VQGRVSRVAASVVLALIAIAAVGGRAEGQTSRVLDRTYACGVELGGGLYAIDVTAHAGSRAGKQWVKLPYVGVRTGNASISTSNLLVWISAGRPIASTTMDLDFWSFGGLGTVGLRRTLCRATSARVPLSRAGLRGGAAPDVGASFTCEAPKRVLVRVRAQLTASAILRGPEYSTVHVPTRSAQIAVRTTNGRQLVYGAVDESGKAQLHTTKGCFPQ
jgi:hypothetical protein